MSFDTIFWAVISGWYYNILGWKLYKQTSYWSKTGFFSQLKIIIKFHPKLFVITSMYKNRLTRWKGLKCVSLIPFLVIFCEELTKIFVSILQCKIGKVEKTAGKKIMLLKRPKYQKPKYGMNKTLFISNLTSICRVKRFGQEAQFWWTSIWMSK